MFLRRHIGRGNIESMLRICRVNNYEKLIENVIPKNIHSPIEYFVHNSENQAISEMSTIMNNNKIYKNYIGTGYYDCITPTVIQRNILENPLWYTAYTPYQAEISQGRLESLYNYQNMISELTGLPVSNSSLLDEATSAAEAVNMTINYHRGKRKKILISKSLHPQNISVIKNRAKYQNIQICIQNEFEFKLDENISSIVLQYPNTFGTIHDYTNIISECKKKDIKIILITDLLALCLLKSPKELNADICVGNTQRFGVPLFNGGPHAAFISCEMDLVRFMPGRIISDTIDRNNNKAYRMVLQTREQHIKKGAATSNICTAQALLANISSFYALYHGKHGLIEIAKKINNNAYRLNSSLSQNGFNVHNYFFDTLHISSEKNDIDFFYKKALDSKINLRRIDENCIGISLDETTSEIDINLLADIFDIRLFDYKCNKSIPTEFLRNDSFMLDDIYSKYNTETELLRYITYLQNKDYSLAHGMIPLGSCTMKLNATTQLIPLGWDSIQKIHPHAPHDQTRGYKIMISELDDLLCNITGFDKISFQPNSGSNGEYAGLITIIEYLNSINQSNRKICLIPKSAHGTNFASAKMAGLKIKEINCNKYGEIDIDDLDTLIEKYNNDIACLMVTYPSTHGVFEENIQSICEKIHNSGGQVYMDGANMNAQCGLTNPVICGADVCHLNLHKTFAIPHGGGGPGVGPIGVKKHLIDFLPSNDLSNRVSGAPYGSASILTISYLYLKLLGSHGVRESSLRAILNANYMMFRLNEYFDILYKNKNGYCAHEFIIDLRKYRKYGITEMDIAKRLLDYSFHSPTVSWPVPGSIMIEPTESESQEELDRFINAMINIKSEINDIINGKYSKEDNMLVNSPHDIREVFNDWNHSYKIKDAFKHFDGKFYPSVSRINDVYGDKKFINSIKNN